MNQAKVIKVGLTGGIGSGKSTVCRMFAILGVPVYYSDERAKELMAGDACLVSEITEAFGREVYSAGRLDNNYLAGRVFNDRSALEKLNSLVHPAVMRDFSNWAESRDTPYVIIESAIIFEAGLRDAMDYVVTVSAPEDMRIERVIGRDNTCRTKVEARIANQMNDDLRESLADYVIRNDDKSLVWEQVLDLHSIFTGAHRNAAF